jgi:predicted amidophosphoribosyltransferase
MPLVSTSGLCPFCDRIPEELDAFMSCGYFHGVLKELVSALKKGDAGAARYLGALVYGGLKGRGWETLPLVPVPPRKGKLRRQGWDQVDLLGKVLRKEYGVTVCACLKRTDAVQQKSLDYGQRLSHMSRCLVLRTRPPIPPAEKGIVLLDDIFTSGATMAAAAGILKSERKRPVYGAVLCSVV